VITVPGSDADAHPDPARHATAAIQTSRCIDSSLTQ
jgi:hypothetical protein